MENKEKRKIDESIDQTVSSIQSKYRMIPTMQIKAWKAYLTVAFVGGFFAAIIWASYASLYSSLEASEGPQTSLFVVSSAAAHKNGEEFTADIFLDTGGKDIVAVQAVALFEKENLQVIQVDTSSSAFNLELKNSLDENAGKIFLGLARPHPGVNSNEGKVATVTLRALKDVTEPFLSLKFDSKEALDDSAAILDDGKGTNILAKIFSKSAASQVHLPEQSKLSESEVRIAQTASDKELEISSVAALTDTLATLSLAGSEESGSYAIERKTGKTDFSQVASLSGEIDSFVDRSLKPGKVYAFRVCRLIGAEKSCSRAERVKTMAKRKIAKPSLKASIENGKVRLDWSPSYTPDFRLTIQRRLLGQKKLKTLAVFSSEEQNSYLDETVEPGKTFVYRLTVSASRKRPVRTKDVKIVIP